MIDAVLVLASVDLISPSIDVEVMNAILLPIVLGFLLALEAKALPSSTECTDRIDGSSRASV